MYNSIHFYLCLDSCPHYPDQDIEYFQHSRRFPLAPSQSMLPHLLFIFNTNLFLKLFYLFIYLFIYLFGCVGCSLRACVVTRGLFVVACGLSSCGARAPESLGSVVVALGLSCPAACGILVSRSGIEPVSPALESRFLTTGPPGKSQHKLIILFYFIYLFTFGCATWLTGS